MPLDQPSRFFRAVYKDYQLDPLPSRSLEGRFHDEDTRSSTTYLAMTQETAWKEVTYRWRATPDSYRMAEVLVKLEKVVDLTDKATQTQHGINEEVLKGDDYRPCQELARRLRAQGVEGLLTFSRADQPTGRQLVIFLDLLTGRSRVHVERVRKVFESPLQP